MMTWDWIKKALQNAAKNTNNLTLMSTQLEVTARAIFAQPNATRIFFINVCNYVVMATFINFSRFFCVSCAVFANTPSFSRRLCHRLIPFSDTFSIIFHVKSNTITNASISFFIASDGIIFGKLIQNIFGKIIDRTQCTTKSRCFCLMQRCVR